MNPAVVIDQGSSTCRFGTSNDTVPDTFPTYYGVRFKNLLQSGISTSTYYICNETKCNESLLHLKYPINRGSIDDPEMLAEIWGYIYNAKKVKMQNFPVIITDSYLNPKSNREKIAEIMFEKMKVPALWIAIRSVLSLMSIGKTTGMMVNCGYGYTQITPIYNGYSFPFAISRLMVGGKDITENLKTRLCQQGYYFGKGYETEIVNNIKEKFCYVSLNSEEERNQAMNTCTYELPDGRTITIGNEKFESPEALFNPFLVGVYSDGIPKLIFDATRKSSIETRKLLFKNIHLCGGTSQLPNFGARLENDITNLIPRNFVNVEINTSLIDRHSAWTGGSILANLSSAHENYVTLKQYSDHGSNIIYKKFF